MRVLVVDDEKIVADSTVLVFQKYGHEAKAVYCGEDAINVIHKFQPNLLLTDVKMSGMNGIELAIRMCAEMPSCKILLMSGQTETANLLETAKEQGLNFEIVAKPIMPAELVNKAVQMVNG